MAVIKGRNNYSKSDLKSGQVVEYRNGNRRIVIKDFAGMDDDILFGCGTFERWTRLSNYNDDLTHKSKTDLDIVAVYNHYMDKASTGVLYFDDDLVFTELEAKKMTVAEICDTLGYDVEIVK